MANTSEEIILSILNEIKNTIIEPFDGKLKPVEENILWDIINAYPKDIPKLKPLKLKPTNFNRQIFCTEEDYQSHSILDFSFPTLFNAFKSTCAPIINNNNINTENKQLKEKENKVEQTISQKLTSPPVDSVQQVPLPTAPILPETPKQVTQKPLEASPISIQSPPQIATPKQAITSVSSSLVTKEKKIRYSKMTREEHAQYLDLLQKYNSSLRTSDSQKPLNPLSFQQLIKLRDKLIKERDEYKNWYLDQVTKKIYKYFYYPRFVQKHTENYLEERKRDSLDLITSHYRSLSTTEKIDLVSSVCTPTSTDPILTHEATVLNLGKVIHWENPPLPTPLLSEATNDFYGNSSLQASYLSSNKTYKKVKVPVVSRDENVEKLLQSFPVDIVISSSSVVTLIDNISPNFENQWEIPITVKVISPDANNTQVKSPYKVVMIDKPLIKETLTLREKNNLYYKSAFKGAGLQFSSPKSIIFPPPSKNPDSSIKESSDSKDQNNTNPLFNTYDTNENLTYNLWRFGKMRLLVRCRIHGVIPDASVKRGYRYVGIKTKLEYQKKKGFEITTQSETARWWMYTFLRPDAHLIVGHVDPLSSTLIHVSQRDMPQILTPTCNFNPIYPSKQMFVIFENLRTLSPGQYILSHKAGETSISLYQSCSEINEGDITLDAHQRIKESGASDLKKIPFVMTAWKPSPNHVPFTFPPPPSTHIPSTPSNDKENKTYHKQIGKYCRSFFTSGECHKENCPYPHLSRVEVESRLENNPKNGKKKKKRKKKRKTPPQENSSPSVTSSPDHFAPNKRQKTHNFHNHNLAPDLLQIVNEIL